MGYDLFLASIGLYLLVQRLLCKGGLNCGNPTGCFCCLYASVYILYLYWVKGKEKGRMSVYLRAIARQALLGCKLRMRTIAIITF